MKTKQILMATFLTTAICAGGAYGTLTTKTTDNAVVPSKTVTITSHAPKVTVANETTNTYPNAPTITSKAAFLLETNSGKVLFAQNADAHLPVASMTKIATLGVIYDALAKNEIKMDDLVMVSERASSMGGSQAFLDAGSEYSVHDLIQSIVVASANDSCVALAEHIAGSVESFVERMNEFAKNLGCQNTNFVNCTGLPTPGAYSCARDMATMYLAIMRSPHYGDFNQIWMYDLTHPSGRVTGLTNTNKLIRRYSGCLGGKTGFTNEAGHCITVAAKRGDIAPIAVIIGAPNSQTRFNESSNLLDYACQNFENQLLVDCTQPLKTVTLKNAVAETIDLYPAHNYYHLTMKGGDTNIAIATEIPDTVTAPFDTTTDLGKIMVTDNGKVIAEIPVQTKAAVPRASYWQTVQKVVRKANFAPN
ncbi:MAG: D-alanyl-D-alanine carboxypeptidase [Clostridia bacterium]|nr:D-alanyl-D-alanine carboxypeptidase [Clostridia bacterium]